MTCHDNYNGIPAAATHASSLACFFLFSNVFTGHRALGRRAYLTLLGSAIQLVKALC